MLTGDILRVAASRVPDKIMLVGQGHRWSFAEADAKTNQFANALIAAGLASGARVAIMSSNRPEYALSYFGIARSGHVSAHVSFRSSVEEAAFVLNLVEAELIIFESRFAGLVDEARESVASLSRFVFLDDGSGSEQNVTGAVSFPDFINSHPESSPVVEIQEDDPVAITFTGGTTGFPKAVLVNHKARSATAYAAAIDFDIDERDVVLCATPLFHTAGLFVWFVNAVMMGARAVMQSAWDPVEFLDTVDREKVTAAFLVPSQLNDLVSHPEFSTAKLGTLRKMGFAGAPMSKALFERIQDALPDVEFTENYGQSEVCPITIRRPWHPREKMGSVGRPAFNVEIEVSDSSGNILPRGEVGEVIVRSEQAFTEYYNDPEQTARAFRNRDGWIWTGDVGQIDEDGFLTLVDRAKDMLVSGGENIYPAELENVLYKHDAVAECAVFGIPHEQWGEVPAAHVVLVSDCDCTEQQLIDFCAAKVARFKRPRLVKFVDSLPKTAVGKIQKVVLREAYWTDRDKNI
jgi:acyl-CoA synthetase (AMP-forming)/AMP-acid ligase II